MRPQLNRIVYGTLGGLAAAFAMRQALTWWHQATRYDVRYGAFGLDEEADVNSIWMLWRLFSDDVPSHGEALRIATQFHYAYGALGGAGYATASVRFPTVRAGFGTGYGALIWLLGDEVPIAAFGISDPVAKSWSSHLAALTGHLIYGSMIDLTLGAAEKLWLRD